MPESTSAALTANALTGAAAGTRVARAALGRTVAGDGRRGRRVGRSRVVRQRLQAGGVAVEHADQAPCAVLRAVPDAVVVEVVARRVLRAAGAAVERDGELLRHHLVEGVDRRALGACRRRRSAGPCRTACRRCAGCRRSGWPRSCGSRTGHPGTPSEAACTGRRTWSRRTTATGRGHVPRPARRAGCT